MESSFCIVKAPKTWESKKKKNPYHPSFIDEKAKEQTHKEMS